MSLLCSFTDSIFLAAFDLRAMRRDFDIAFDAIVSEELQSTLSISATRNAKFAVKLRQTMQLAFDKTTTMDAADQMDAIASSATIVLLDTLTTADSPMFNISALASIPQFRTNVANRATVLMDNLRAEYLGGKRGPSPASAYLGKTKSVYEYIRVDLGIKMHGTENYAGFPNGLGVDDQTIGQNVSLIHESIRDGKIQGVVAELFRA